MALDQTLIKTLRADIDYRMPRLIEISESIHSHPELAHQEHFALEILTKEIVKDGHQVIKSAYGTQTGFSAEIGSPDSPCVAIVLEYDALPGIGHACGHNVIAAAGLGAGLALASMALDAGLRVRLLGTPAEEGGGGKIIMGRNGAFNGIEAALMVHPADRDLIRMNTIAIQELRVNYRGRAAHAAAAPHEGRNALDAAVLGYNAIAALRQHIRDSERVHGIISHGGDKPNIVPEYAQTHWYVRSDTLDSLDPLKSRVETAFRGAALSCECEIEFDWQDFAYSEMLDNTVLMATYEELAKEIGRDVSNPNATERVLGSTDMGNVSHVVPSVHPMIAIADPGTPIHTADFARAAIGERANSGIRDGAILLGELALSVCTDRVLGLKIRNEFGQNSDPKKYFFA